MAAESPSDSTPSSDAQLLRAYAARGDQAAFSALVDRHIDLVFSAARRLMRHRQDAEDVTQAVFIALARRAAQLDDKIVLPAWLYRTTLFVCKDAQRSNIRRTRREMASAMESKVSVQDAPSENDPPWIELLDPAMASLSESDRTLLILRFFKGQSVSEISAALHVAPNSISKRLERAIGRLRRFFVRRGVGLTGTALAVGLAAHSVGAAPAGLSLAVAHGATATASIAAATTAQTLAKGALVAMKTSTQIKSGLMIAAAILVLLASTGLVIHILSGGSGIGAPTQPLVLASAPAAVTPAHAPLPAAAPPRLRQDLPEYLPGGTIPVLADPSRKDDRGLGQTIEAELFDDSNGVEVVAPGISNWATSNSVRYDDVDFGSPAAERSSNGPATDFFANIGCPTDESPRLEVRVDAPSGTPICVLNVKPNGGIQQRNAQRVSLAQSVQGRHTVYLSLSGKPGISAVNLDWFKFVSLPHPAMQRIDAEQFDAMRGAAVTYAGLAHLDTGDFLRYSSVAFGENLHYVHVNCGVRKQYAGHFIVFRIDDVNGPVIAQLKVRNTGEFTQFETQTAPVQRVSGLHDLYITFNGNGVANIKWFQFSPDSTPPPDTQPSSPPTQPTTRAATSGQ